MLDYLTIGPAPADEPCAQVGSENYKSQTKMECFVYIKQLKRVYGEPPEGSYLRIKGFPHDFGTYHEVVVEYENEKGMEYAFKCESGCAEWDEESKAELKALGYQFNNKGEDE